MRHMDSTISVRIQSAACEAEELAELLKWQELLNLWLKPWADFFKSIAKGIKKRRTGVDQTALPPPPTLNFLTSIPGADSSTASESINATAVDNKPALKNPDRKASEKSKNELMESYAQLQKSLDGNEDDPGNYLQTKS